MSFLHFFPSLSCHIVQGHWVFQVDFFFYLFFSMSWNRDHVIAILRPVIRFSFKECTFSISLLFIFPSIISHLTQLYPQLATLTSIFFWVLKFQSLRTISGSLIPLRYNSSNPTYYFGCFLCFWYKDIEVVISSLLFKIMYVFIVSYLAFLHIWNLLVCSECVYVCVCVYWWDIGLLPTSAQALILTEKQAYALNH